MKTFLCVVLLLAAGMARAEETNGLRVLSWNIRTGRGMDGKPDLDRIAAVIRAADVDLVALQEVDRGTRRSKGVDQPAELARQLPGYTPFFVAAMPYDGGEYGVCLFSRLPVRGTRRIALPTDGKHEPRAAALLEVEWGARMITFVGTHLANEDDGMRRVQAKALAAELEKCGPAVLAGDFNAEPDAESLKELVRDWTLTWPGPAPKTYPADQPTVAIDHILVRPAAGAATCERVEEAVASDHRPVRAVIRF